MADTDNGGAASPGSHTGLWARLDGLALFRPNFFRQTPFRLTLVFLAVYVFAAGLVFGYIYLVTTTESRAYGDAAISARLNMYKALDAQSGHAAVVGRILEEESAAVAELEEFISKSIRFQAEEHYSQEQFDVVLL